MTRRQNTIIDTQIPGLIAGKYEGNKYFASNQTLIFVGPYLIDEALACSYKLEQRKVPIYGYASQYYDAVASGKVIVTGSLTINYVDSGYLYLAMVEATSKNFRTSTYAEIDKAIRGSNDLGKKISSQLGEILRETPYGSDPNNSRSMRNVAQLVAQNPLASQETIQTLRKKYWNAAIQNSAFRRNATTADIQRFFSTQNRGNTNPDTFLFARPDQMPSINLTVSHGNPLQDDKNTYRVIRDLHIVSVEQHISPTGQAQSETYTFFARSFE